MRAMGAPARVPFGKQPSVRTNFCVTNKKSMLSDASLASWAIGRSRFVGTAAHAGKIRRARDLRSILPYNPLRSEREKSGRTF